MCVCVKALQKMGQRKSKHSDPMGGNGKRLPDIPPDSPLGMMIKFWNSSPRRRNKSKEKMIHYCIEIWGGKPLRNPHIIWPAFGSSEDWLCQQLNLWVNSKEPINPEESEYASLWISAGEEKVSLYALKEKKQGRSCRPEDDVYNWPPPYNPQDPPPRPHAPRRRESSESSDSDPETIDPRQTPQGPDTLSGPVTRSRTRGKLYPIREILLPGGGVQEGMPGTGYVSVPLNTGDVRDFKKEMGNLLDDPLGVAEKIDQFLGPNLYTWDEMQAILGILFTLEEREMIRREGMRI